MNMEAIGVADHVEAFGMTEFGLLATGYKRKPIDHPRTPKEIVCDTVMAYDPDFDHPEEVARDILQALRDGGYHVLELVSHE